MHNQYRSLEDYPCQMTNEIAFEIGKGDYNRFYDYPTWKPNVEYFKYAKFFNWGNPTQGGAPKLNGEIEWLWFFYGSLKEELFNLEQKKHYIKGVLASYAGKILGNSLSFNFANSSGTRDRIAKWADEILKEKFGGKKTWVMKKDEKPTCPMIVSLVIEADEEALSYLTDGYQDYQSSRVPKNS